MSGIAGILHLDGAPASADALDAMAAASAPFIGPDGVGAWRSGPVGMLRFHAATTPEAVGEVQPFRNPDSGNAICFDGRIDNRADLLARLDRAAAADAPDCAIVLALFDRFGDAMLDMLVGDYALAIWSERRRRLFCARSPLGWRPFLWTCDGRRFGFASQPRTLVEGLGLERRLNEGAIGEYLSARFVTQTETFWQDVNRLAAGGALAVEDGRVRLWQWFRGPFEDKSGASEAELVERFRSLFDAALVSAMRSDRPVLSQLSGGLDSSSVVCRATQLHRAGAIDRQVIPVSVRYPGAPQDETKWSSMVERELGIEAVVATPDPLDLDAQRRFCAETYHLPLRPNVMTAMTRIMRAHDARILLTGEGGDDWLYGSHGHWPDLLLRGKWPTALGEAFATNARRLPGALRLLAAHGAGPIFSRRQRESALRPHLDFSAEPPPWIGKDWARRTGLAERWRNDPLPVDLPSYAQRQRYQVYWFSRRHVNWDNVLAFVDSNGIELRHPLHDLRLTKFLMGVDGGMLWRGPTRKYLLRQAMRGVLPEGIRTRSDKANFVLTILDAACERLREHPFEQHYSVRMGWVDPVLLADAQARFVAWRDAGSRREEVPKAPYNAVWFTLALDLWLENAFGI
ncbi:MAG TPA: asparagine synthase-related protein [Allosphingosinicella sp.]|nr:asparagine synthase-related protein [Allosphingosinicella sp.]